MTKNIEKERLPNVRWAMIRTCRVGGHAGVTDTMLLDVVRAEYITATREQIRTEMHYLESRKLLTLEKSEVKPWRAVLTRHGFDVADYQVECERGIERPPQIDA